MNPKTSKLAPSNLALTALRRQRRWSQAELAEASGWSRIALASWENGTRPLADENLLQLAACMGYDPLQVEPLLLVLTGLSELPAPRRGGSLAPLPEAAVQAARRQAVQHGFEQARELERRLLAEARIRMEADERKAADAFVRELVPLAPERWKERKEQSRGAGFYGWAFVERACAQSLTERGSAKGRGLEWARLALAGSEDPDPELQDRQAGYTWAFFGYAFLSAGDLTRADNCFSWAREFWKDGKGAETLPLEPWRPLELEAALYREQEDRTFALGLHRMALEAAPASARPLLLLGQAETLERFGESSDALDPLFLAWQALDGESWPQRRIQVGWKLAELLSHLGRSREAAPILDEIRPLALDLGRRLEVTRCLWLQARLAAAEGLADRALRTFQQVRRDLEGQQKPHDLAEVELEILALYLDLGDGHQVRTKAAEIGWVETTPSLPEPVKAALPPLREAGRQGKEAVLPLRKAQAELRRYRPRVRP